jgi:hypothetical protein
LAQAHEEALKDHRERAEAQPPAPDDADEEEDEELFALRAESHELWRERWRRRRKF